MHWASWVGLRSLRALDLDRIDETHYLYIALSFQSGIISFPLAVPEAIHTCRLAESLLFLDILPHLRILLISRFRSVFLVSSLVFFPGANIYVSIWIYSAYMRSISKSRVARLVFGILSICVLFCSFRWQVLCAKDATAAQTTCIRSRTSIFGSNKKTNDQSLHQITTIENECSKLRDCLRLSLRDLHNCSKLYGIYIRLV